jgi:hypothetical protein
MLLVLIMLPLPAIASATSVLPAGLMMIGFDGTSWHPYVSESLTNSWRKIAAISNPAGVTYQSYAGRFLFKESDGRLYEYMDGDSAPTPLQQFDSTSFTQLRAFDEGFVMVKLVDGKSRETELVSLYDDYRPASVVRQVSAQFHPLYHGNRLYYSHVSCRLECEPLIQEVWVKDLITGNARQLTLLNATSYLHSIDRSGRYGFISSNSDGYYNLARLDLSTSAITWLTTGRFTDSYPTIVDDSTLYFLRRTPEGTRLMRLADALGGPEAFADTGNAETVHLPDGVEKVRYLENSR